MLEEKYIRCQKIYEYESLQDFAEQIEEAVKEGYSVSREIKFCARVLGHGDFSITMIKESEANTESKDNEVVEDLKSTVAPEKKTAISEKLQELKEKKKKTDLIEFAGELNLDIPEDIKVVTAIKKYIKEKIEKGEA